MSAVRQAAEALLRIAGDDRLALAILAASPQAPLRTTLFHAQQAVEKALKAVLTLKGGNFRKTHDLEELHGCLLDAGLTCPTDLASLSGLNPYAVLMRYEDFAPATMSAAEALSIVQTIIQWAEAQLTDTP